MKKLIIISVFVVTMAVILIFSTSKFMKNEIGADDYLVENDDYSLVFVVYDTMARRYTIYPEKTMNFTKGWRKEEFIITNPLCFKEILNSEQTIISDDDYERIEYLIEKIDIENIGFGYDVIQQGGNRYFIYYNEVSCEIPVTMFFDDEHGDFMEDGYNALMEIEQILKEYFE